MHDGFLIIETLFGVAMFANACFFIPQAITLYRAKDSSEVSLISFIGFLSIQFIVVLHGIIVHDFLLVYGTLISMLTCGTVVFLIIYYRLKKPKCTNSLKESLSKCWNKKKDTSN